MNRYMWLHPIDLGKCINHFPDPKPRAGTWVTKIIVRTSMLKSLVVDKGFQTWHLIGWQHSRKPITSHVRQSLSFNMDFNIGFT